MLDFMFHICPICGKEFCVRDEREYVFRDHTGKFVCSYQCRLKDTRNEEQKRNQRKCCVPISLIDKDGHIIAKYPSIKAAAMHYNVAPESLYRAVRERRYCNSIGAYPRRLSNTYQKGEQNIEN